MVCAAIYWLWSVCLRAVSVFFFGTFHLLFVCPPACVFVPVVWYMPLNRHWLASQIHHLDMAGFWPWLSHHVGTALWILGSALHLSLFWLWCSWLFSSRVCMICCCNCWIQAPAWCHVSKDLYLLFHENSQPSEHNGKLYVAIFDLISIILPSFKVSIIIKIKIAQHWHPIYFRTSDWPAEQCCVWAW